MDQARYFLMTKNYSDGFSLSGTYLKSLLLGNHPTHTHLVPMLAALPYRLFEGSTDAAIYINTVFFAGILLFVFALGSRLAGPPYGFLAALLAAGYPMLSRFSRFFLLEEASAFFTIASIYFLVRTHYFSNGRWSIPLGITVGLALLTKWTTVVFIGPPVALVFLGSLLIRPRGARLEIFREGCIVLAAITLIAAPWYVSRWNALIEFLGYSEEGLLFAGDGPGLDQLLLYVKLYIHTTGLPFAVIAAFGIGYLLVRHSLYSVALLVSVLVPVMIFSFAIATRDIRHLLPALPSVILASVLAIRSLRPHPLRLGLMLSVSAVALFSAYYSAWGLPPRQSLLSTDRAIWSLLPPRPHLPDSREWHFRELLEVIQENSGTATRKGDIRVTVVAGNSPFRTNGFRFLAASTFPSIGIKHVPFFLESQNPHHKHLGAASLLQTDYYLLREGDVNANANGMFAYSEALQRLLRLSPVMGRTGAIQTIHQVRLPTGATARVIRANFPPCGSTMLKYLDWAHQTDPDDPEILRLVDGCKEQLTGEDALVWQKLSGILHPNPSDSHLGLTRRLHLEEVASGSSSSIWAIRLLADDLYATNEFARAAELYQALPPDAPYSCSPLVWAGRALSRTGRTKEAIDALTAGLNHVPDCQIGYQELSRSLEKIGAHAAARREERILALLAQRRALGERVETGSLRLSIGNLARDANRLEEACHHYLLGLENEPGHIQLKRRMEELTGMNKQCQRSLVDHDDSGNHTPQTVRRR